MDKLQLYYLQDIGALSQLILIIILWPIYYDTHFKVEKTKIQEVQATWPKLR